MSPVNAQTDFGDALDDTWDEKLTGFLNKVASQPYKYDYFSLLRQLESVKFVTGGKLLGKAVSPKMEKIRIRQEPSLEYLHTPHPNHSLKNVVNPSSGCKL